MASLSPGLLRARKAELVEFWVVSFDLKVEGTAAARNSRRTVVKGRTGYPCWEVSWKLTIGLGFCGTESRQVREVLKNANVACEGAGKIREG